VTVNLFATWTSQNAGSIFAPSVAANRSTLKFNFMEAGTAILNRQASRELVRPFHCVFPQADLDELRRRVEATRWSEKQTVDDLSQGVTPGTLQAIANFWARYYDWRRIEAKINARPAFRSLRK